MRWRGKAVKWLPCRGAMHMATAVLACEDMVADTSGERQTAPLRGN